MSHTQTSIEELVSLTFIMGRLMKDKIHKKIANGQCNSLLEFETLRYVNDTGQPHMRDVAKNFHVSPPAATLMIDGMVRDKMLIRVLDPKDRRSVRVSLTLKGKQMLDHGITKKVKEMKKVFAILTPKETIQFVDILKKIIKNNL
jgi:DNA-binding MarR family transcriptional regulator